LTSGAQGFVVLGSNPSTTPKSRCWPTYTLPFTHYQ